MRPKLMPAEHLANKNLDDGGLRLLYDANGDARGDYAEQQGPDGRVRTLHFDTDDNGELDLEVSLDQIAKSDCRELLIILDSVPYDMVKELRDQGRFRLFFPPSRIIAPFPAMTDMSLAEFSGTSPCLALESCHYDGRRLHRGYLTYFSEGNAPWLASLDAYIWPIHHSQMYLYPDAGYLHELHHIEQVFLSTNKPTVRGYCVGSSALGSIYGREGHERVLVTADRFCQSVMQRTRGHVHITLMSDHGHNLVDNEYVPLHKQLAALGYRNVDHLRRDNDIIVPRFGPVTCAGIHTRQPARVAADVVTLESIELAFYRDQDQVIVRSQAGSSRISRRDDKYRYESDAGDPLRLLPIVETLKQRGRLDADGFASDSDWFEVTKDHVYPDPLYRLWRAFYGLFVHTPDVLVSFKDGYVFNTSFFNFFVKMKSAHGSIRDSSTFGFVMSTAGKLPDHVRMEDLACELEKVGLGSAQK